ncbi:MAG: hypothetical protein JRN12_06180 [Nitrososphaerota archaeon]|nr:hypothetical protein [Nitrososphaerota archaeon]
MSGQPQGVEQMVSDLFVVKQSFSLPDGEYEFQVEYDEGTKSKFARLKEKAAGLGYKPGLTGGREECVLTLKKAEQAPGKAPRLPVFFLLFTLAALVVSSIEEFEVNRQLLPSFASYLGFFAFWVCVAAVLAAHELGQRLMAKSRDAGHASSYVIPGIPIIPPYLPSLGFATSQREPALNRDSLFDAVVAGPLAMLFLSILLYAIGDVTASQSTVPFASTQLANTTVTVPPNAIQMGLGFLLSPLTRAVPAGYVLVSPMADAAAIGFILVFLSLLPVAFYDGGVLASAAWGQRSARIAGYLSVLALLAIDTPNYWAVAIIALILVGRPFQPKLLDEVSGLSNARRLLVVALIVVAILCIPVPQNIATFPLG